MNPLENSISTGLAQCIGRSPPMRGGGDETKIKTATNCTDRVFATVSWTNVVHIWRVVDMQFDLLEELRHPHFVYAAAWSPTNEHLLATTSEDGYVRLFDVRADAKMLASWWTYNRGTSAPTAIDFDPLGESLATGCWNGTVTRWNTKTQQQVGSSAKIHDTRVTHMRHSPCGAVLATGDFAGVVVLWNVTNSQLLPLKTLGPNENGPPCRVTWLKFDGSIDPPSLSVILDGGPRQHITERTERLNLHNDYGPMTILIKGKI